LASDNVQLKPGAFFGVWGKLFAVAIETLDNLTPIEVYTGRAKEVLAKRAEIKKRTLQARGPSGKKPQAAALIMRPGLKESRFGKTGIIRVGKRCHMKKIVLISCVKMKLSYRSKAKDLYTSTLFRSNLEYTRRLTPDAIYILSAKYGLVGLEDEIDTYNLTLNKMTVS
jgi:hypothetical protein